MLTMFESLNYSFRNPKNIIWVIYRIKQLRNYKKTMGSSEDPSLINSVDDLGLVYYGLKGFVSCITLCYIALLCSPWVRQLAQEVTADASLLLDKAAVFLAHDKRYTRYIYVAILSLRNPASKYKQLLKEMAATKQKGRYIRFMFYWPCVPVWSFWNEAN